MTLVKRHRRLLNKDRLSEVTNLFDASMIFAVVPIARNNVNELFPKEVNIIAKKPAGKQIKSITNKGETIETHKASIQ